MNVLQLAEILVSIKGGNMSMSVLYLEGTIKITIGYIVTYVTSAHIHRKIDEDGKISFLRFSLEKLSEEQLLQIISHSSCNEVVAIDNILEPFCPMF